MPSPQTNPAAAPQGPASLRNAVRVHLERVRAGILDEIRHYPPPIPACDVQFNTLLEEREAVARELSALDALGLDADEPRAWRAFLSASRFVDADTLERLCGGQPAED